MSTTQPLTLNDQTWRRIALLALALDCGYSSVIQQLCDQFLDQFETRLPGTVLDDNTPAGFLQRLKGRAQDELNLKAPLNAAENIPGMLAPSELGLTGLKPGEVATRLGPSETGKTMFPIPKESPPQAVAVMLASGTPEQRAEAWAILGDGPDEEDGPWAAGWLFRSGKTQVGSFVRLFGDRPFTKGTLDYNLAIVVSLNPPALVDCGGDAVWQGKEVLAMRLVTEDVSKFGEQWVQHCRKQAMDKWNGERRTAPTLQPPDYAPRAFQAGWRCRTGECALTNPYPMMTSKYNEWLAGYEQADRFLHRRKQAVVSESNAVERELTGDLPALPSPLIPGEDDPNGVQ